MKAFARFRQYQAQRKILEYIVDCVNLCQAGNATEGAA